MKIFLIVVVFLVALPVIFAQTASQAGAGLISLMFVACIADGVRKWAL